MSFDDCNPVSWESREQESMKAVIESIVGMKGAPADAKDRIKAARLIFSKDAEALFVVVTEPADGVFTILICNEDRDCGCDKEHCIGLYPTGEEFDTMQDAINKMKQMVALQINEKKKKVEEIHGRTDENDPDEVIKKMFMEGKNKGPTRWISMN